MKLPCIRLSALAAATTLLAACGANAVPAAPSAPSSSAALSVQSTEPQPKLDVPVGAPPAPGWGWEISVHENGGHDVIEAKDHHDNPWLFFVLKGSEDVDLPDGMRTLHADEGLVVPDHVDHGHRFAPRTQVLNARLGPADATAGDYHGGYPGIYFSNKPLDTKSGAEYKLRVREYTLAPGQRRPDATLTDPAFVFVIDGALTVRPASGSATPVDTYKVAMLSQNGTMSIGNEAQSPAKFILVDLHQ